MSSDFVRIARHALLTVLVIGVPSVLSHGCAGQEDEDGDILEETNDEESGSGQAVQDDQGNDGNQASGDDDDDQSSGSGEDVNNDTSGSDAPLGDDAPDTGSAPALNTPPENPAPPPPEPAPANNAAPPAGGAANAAPAAPAAPADGAPVQGGRVRYAKAGGTSVTSAAGSGSSVRTLEQGDHPVTWEDNGFLKLANGQFVATDAMSDKGVKRSGSANPWK